MSSETPQGHVPQNVPPDQGRPASPLDAADVALQQGTRLAANSADFLQQFGKVLTGITTVIAAAGVLLGDGQIRVVAIVAGVVGVLGVVWLIALSSKGPRRSRETDLPPERSMFRGLIPFQAGDTLPRREQECTLLYTIVTDRDFRVGLAYGEPGCGKTSLLRAGLVPRLRSSPDRRWTALYVVAQSTAGPQDLQAAIRDELQAELGVADPAASLDALLANAAKQAGPIVIICDQFEEFFLGRDDPALRQPFLSWVAECVANEHLPVRFVFALRRGFEDFARELEAALGRTIRGQDQFTLRRFSPDQALDVLRDLAATDRVALTPGLRAAVVRHLTFDDSVCPAELQVVGRWLKERGIRTEAAYEGVGRVEGLLRAYLTEEMESMDQSSARYILGLLAGRSGAEAPAVDRGRILTATQEATVQAGRTNLVQSLQRLMQDGLVIQEFDRRYRLVHGYFVNAVREAVDGRIRRRERLLWRARQAGVAYGATAAAGVLAGAVALAGSAVTLASAGPRELQTLSYPPGLVPNNELVAFSADGAHLAVHYAGTTLVWAVPGALSSAPVAINQPFTRGFVPLSLEFKPDDNHLTIVAVHAGLRQWAVSTVDLSTPDHTPGPTRTGALLADVELSKCELHTAYASSSAGVAVAYACPTQDSPIDLLADTAADPNASSRTLPRAQEDSNCEPVRVAFTQDARLMAAYSCDAGAAAGFIKMRQWPLPSDVSTSTKLPPTATGDPRGLMTGPAGHPMLSLKTDSAAELWDLSVERKVAWLPVNDLTNPHPVGLSADGRFLAQQVVDAQPNKPLAVGLYEMGRWFGPINVPVLIPAVTPG